MNNDYEDQLLDEYLLDRLDEADRLAVEKRAAGDPAFAAEIELRRTLMQGIELAGEENLKAKIARTDASLAQKGFFSELETPQKLVATDGWLKHPRILWAAATLVLLLSAGLWLFLQNRDEQTNNIASSTPTNNAMDSTRQGISPQLPETPPAPPVKPSAPPDRRYAALARSAYVAPDFSNLRSVGGEPASLMEQASEAYENGDFSKALQLLDALPSTAPGYWQAAEIRAHALFRSGNTRQAAKVFRQIAESGQLPFSERAEWHLLICYGMDYPNQKNAFDSLSTRILTDSGHPGYEQTKALKRTLGLQ